MFKVPEFPVSLNKNTALACSLCIHCWRQHPYVLDCGTVYEIVKVKEEPAICSMEQVAYMTVAMYAVNRNLLAELLVYGCYLQRGVCVFFPDVCRQKAVVVKECKGFPDKILRRELQSVGSRLCSSDVVYARNEASQVAQICIVQFIPDAAAGAF